MIMSKEKFMQDVYDNLMKNTIYKPTDFSKSKEECFMECDKNIIHIGNFVLEVKTYKEYMENDYE
tara:strand:- start:2001 stop:2195 length:195 start_codon:yes stop_codon:yes gene_type:complete